MFYLEIDQLIDLIERPIFRHLQLRLLDYEDDPYSEGSGAMLFLALKRIMMLLPQSTSYMISQERLSSVARYRQSAVSLNKSFNQVEVDSQTHSSVKQIVKARRLHVWAKWRMIRAESLEEEPCRIVTDEQKFYAQQQRREWLGYANEEEETATKQKIKESMTGNLSKRAELVGVYERLADVQQTDKDCEMCASSGSPVNMECKEESLPEPSNQKTPPEWKAFWKNR